MERKPVLSTGNPGALGAVTEAAVIAVAIVAAAAFALWAVTQIVSGLIGVLIPVALVAGGTHLMSTGRRGLGWAGVGIGGLLLLSHLPFLLVAVGVVAIALMARAED